MAAHLSRLGLLLSCIREFETFAIFLSIAGGFQALMPYISAQLNNNSCSRFAVRL